MASLSREFSTKSHTNPPLPPSSPPSTILHGVRRRRGMIIKRAPLRTKSCGLFTWSSDHFFIVVYTTQFQQFIVSHFIRDNTLGAGSKRSPSFSFDEDSLAKIDIIHLFLSTISVEEAAKKWPTERMRNQNEAFTHWPLWLFDKWSWD